MWDIKHPTYSKEAHITNATFLDKINELMNNSLHTKQNVLIMSDFNLHVKKGMIWWLSAQGNFTSTCLRQSVDFPTHMSGTTLDLIIHNLDKHSQITMPLSVFTKPTRKNWNSEMLEVHKLPDVDLAKFASDVALKCESRLQESRLRHAHEKFKYNTNSFCYKMLMHPGLQNKLLHRPNILSSTKKLRNKDRKYIN